MIRTHSQRGQAFTSAAVRVFPAPGSALHTVITDAAFREKFHARLKTLNPFLVWLYRGGLLPLFGAGRSLMLLATQGRRSGRVRYSPVGYVRIHNVLHVFSAWGRKSNWYQNLMVHPEQVEVQVGFRRFGVRAQVLEDPNELRYTLEQFVSESPGAARQLFGWEPGRDRIEAADFSLFIARVLTVRFVER